MYGNQKRTGPVAIATEMRPTALLASASRRAWPTASGDADCPRSRKALSTATSTSKSPEIAEVAIIPRLLPIDSTALLFGSAFDNLSAYVLPVTTMVLVTAPYTIRIARSSICESLASAHTRAAILNGLSRRRILWAYAVLPAATPIINTLALNLVYLISGVVVIENVFNFPGIGRRLVEAITTGDTYTVQAVALLMGAMFIIINLAADLMAAYVNPRLRAR